jgi:hypothetical protein
MKHSYKPWTVGGLLIEENKDLGHTQDQYHELDTFTNFLPSHPSDIADEDNLWLLISNFWYELI